MVLEVRAPRYAIECPLMYRPFNGSIWLNGQLRNISDTGMLFDAEEGTVPVGTMMELQVKLPVAHLTSLNCTGVAVREEIGIPRLAVRIIDSRPDVS